MLRIGNTKKRSKKLYSEEREENTFENTRLPQESVYSEEKSKKVFAQRAYSCSIKREQSFVADTESSLLRTISKN